MFQNDAVPDKKISTVMGRKFYQEHYHSNVTGKEHEKFSVEQLQIHQS